MARSIPLILLTSLVSACASSGGRESIPDYSTQPETIQLSRDDLQQRWRGRIQSILQKGQIPIIDMESSIRESQVEDYLEEGLEAMDRLGIALIAFDGYQQKRTSRSQKGYRPSFYTNQLVNAFPDRFIPTTNGGTNNNWLKEKDSFVGYLESEGYSRKYFVIGELDFRHYMSKRQCKEGRTERDNDISLLGSNASLVFSLATETGMPVAIHLEPEDAPLNELETVLQRFPETNIIVAHFGQLRHPERQRHFTPQRVRRLLSSYPNLYYDLSVGEPGRRYPCNNNVLDTVLWKSSGLGQSDELKEEWKQILTEYDEHFVGGTDYGGGRKPLPTHLEKRVENLRRIMAQLPMEARHNIGYRNAWKLLTGEPWQAR
jgi:hypothetical protein